MNSVELILSTLVGSGIGSAIIGYLFQKKIEKELDIQRAYLQRATKVHELQIEALRKLHAALWRTHAYFQVMNSAGRTQNEAVAEYPKELAKAVVDARDELANSRVLIPVAVTERLDRFFKKLFEGQLELQIARDPMTPDGKERFRHFTSAGKIAYEEIPALLKEIELDARKIIHAVA